MLKCNHPSSVKGIWKGLAHSVSPREALSLVGGPSPYDPPCHLRSVGSNQQKTAAATTPSLGPPDFYNCKDSTNYQPNPSCGQEVNARNTDPRAHTYKTCFGLTEFSYFQIQLKKNREVAQWVKCLLHLHEDLAATPEPCGKVTDGGVTCSPSGGKAEAGHLWLMRDPVVLFLHLR